MKIIIKYPACPACPVAPEDGSGVAPEDGTGVNPACPVKFEDHFTGVNPVKKQNGMISKIKKIKCVKNEDLTPALSR